MNILTGLLGLVIFVMYDIGDVMMMEVMVGILVVLRISSCVHALDIWYLLMTASCNFHLQLCCFNPESTQIVVHSQDL